MTVYVSSSTRSPRFFFSSEWQNRKQHQPTRAERDGAVWETASTKRLDVTWRHRLNVPIYYYVATILVAATTTSVVLYENYCGGFMQLMLFKYSPVNICAVFGKYMRLCVRYFIIPPVALPSMTFSIDVHFQNTHLIYHIFVLKSFFFILVLIYFSLFSSIISVAPFIFHFDFSISGQVFKCCK